MKQPKIKIHGKIHDVIKIEFNLEGELSKLVYLNENKTIHTVFKESILDDSVTNTYIEIKEPTLHPYHNYSLAPDLNSLIICK